MAQVLIVDDSKVICEDVKNHVEAAGLTVCLAMDGNQGFKALRRDSQIRIILCDVNLPGLDGLTLIEKVRAAGNDQVKVLMLTTETDENMKKRARAMGVSGWIVKPFDATTTVGVIKSLIA